MVLSFGVSRALSFAEPSVAGPIAGACAQAGAANHLVLVTLISYDNLVSKNLEENVLAAPAVQAVIREHYQSVRLVRGPASEAVIKQYGVSKYPTVLLLRPDGTEVDRLVGYQAPEAFAARLKTIAEGKDEFPQLQAAVADPKAGVEPRLRLASALMRRARNEEALVQLRWCAEKGPKVDHGGYVRSYRRLFLVYGELSRSMPAARSQLKATRDELESVIKPFDMVWTGSTFACNEALQQPGRNLDLYDKLPAHSPLRQTMFPDIFLTLVEARRYKQANEVRDLTAMIDESLRAQTKDGASASGSQHKFVRSIAYHWAIAATEVYLAVGGPEKARAMAETALRMADDEPTRTALKQAAHRAIGGLRGDEFITSIKEKPTAPKSTSS